MATTHTPRTTRSQAPLQTASSGETSAEAVTLQAALREIQQLREERLQQQAQFETMLLQRDEELRRLEERIQTRENQLSPCHSRNVESSLLENSARNELGYKLKPDNFDGSVPLREFLTQYNLIARANNWNDKMKTIVLASCLRGKARSVLDGIVEIEEFKFADLISKLELRFGDGHLFQTYYTQFTNRKQKFSEDLASLGTDLERLSRLAYPECDENVRDKIACAQFIAALSDGFVKRTLQLEGIVSLKLAVERAMAVKSIQESCFSKNKNEHENSKFKFNKFNGESQQFKRNSEKQREGENIKKIMKSAFFLIIKIIKVKNAGNVGTLPV